MSTTTTNLGLTLPAGTDPADIAVLNTNFTTIDTFAGQQTAKDTSQDARMTAIENDAADRDDRLTALETSDTSQDGRLTALEQTDTAHAGRLTAIETKNTTQDGRLTALETSDTAQDAAIAAKLNTADVDDALSSTSTNPVQNKVIQASVAQLIEEVDTKASLEDILGVGTAITSNANMDSLTESGKWYCSNSAIAATVTNAPFTDTGYFGWTTRSILASDRYVQIAIRNDDDFVVAKRRYYGTWGAWSYLTSTAVT